MGVNADITVHGWRKPTLYLELVEGGTLLADTKYYVCGFMGFTPATYIGIGSPLSDVSDITTTATHRSIQISHKTFRDITAFADNGDSRTLITSERHCVTDNVNGSVTDIIKIDSGSYAGTWDVDEWVNYDQFIIDTSYIDNVPVQFYTDSVAYNQPVVEYGRYYCSGMGYYMSPTDPYATGEFSSAYVWSRQQWETYYIENPAIITSQQVKRFGPYSVQPEVIRLNKGIYKALEPYGIPAIEISGQTTPADVHDEVQLSGFIYNFGYEEDVGYPKNPQLNCLASLRCHGDSGFTVNGASVILLSSVQQLYDKSLLTFNECSIIFPVGFFSAHLNFTAEKCTVFNNSTSNSFMGWIPGDDTIFYIVPRAAYGNVDVSSQQYTNQYTQELEYYGIVQNKEFRDTGVSTTFQNSYNTIKFKNVITYPIYWLFNKAVYPDIYFMEDVTINEAGSYNWHLRFYNYAVTDLTQIDYLNVDTDDSNNVKKCVHNDVVNIIARFHRRVEFYVQDAGGVDINGASIHIVDGDGNEYDDTTDVDGYVYLDCLEQKTVFTNDDPIISDHDPQFDTHYTDFVITISKTGYASQTIHLTKMYQNEKHTVTLLASTAETVLIGSTIYGSTIQ